MKNRAKCKKCLSVIETDGELKSCPCGEIAVHGDMQCQAKDWANFLRVDDEGNVIVPTITDAPKAKPTKDELIVILDEMIASIESLPATAMLSPVNHYDYVAGLMLFSQMFKSL